VARLPRPQRDTLVQNTEPDYMRRRGKLFNRQRLVAFPAAVLISVLLPRPSKLGGMQNAFLMSSGAEFTGACPVTESAKEFWA
jgi:hypothetical protein